MSVFIWKQQLSCICIQHGQKNLQPFRKKKKKESKYWHTQWNLYFICSAESTYLRFERLLAPISWHPCWTPAMRYGTNLCIDPLSTIEPDTPWATFSLSLSLQKKQVKQIIWAASSEFGTYRLCEQRRFRRACSSAQSRQNLRCSLIQAVSQEEPSDRKPDP